MSSDFAFECKHPGATSQFASVGVTPSVYGPPSTPYLHGDTQPSPPTAGLACQSSRLRRPTSSAHDNRPPWSRDGSLRDAPPAYSAAPSTFAWDVSPITVYPNPDLSRYADPVDDGKSSSEYRNPGASSIPSRSASPSAYPESSSYVPLPDPNLDDYAQPEVCGSSYTVSSPQDQSRMWDGLRKKVTAKRHDWTANLSRRITGSQTHQTSHAGQKLVTGAMSYLHRTRCRERRTWR
jgi:hypothetical protein